MRGQLGIEPNRNNIHSVTGLECSSVRALRKYSQERSVANNYNILCTNYTSLWQGIESKYLGAECFQIKFETLMGQSQLCRSECAAEISELILTMTDFKICPDQ